MEFTIEEEIGTLIKCKIFSIVKVTRNGYLAPRQCITGEFAIVKVVRSFSKVIAELTYEEHMHISGADSVGMSFKLIEHDI